MKRAMTVVALAARAVALLGWIAASASSKGTSRQVLTARLAAQDS